MAVAAVDPRATELIRKLNLLPHPEGGFYREVYRSPALVHPVDSRDQRAALTTIYFLLPASEKSRWHRIRSDEIWHYYEGAPLELLQLAPSGAQVEHITLGRLEEGGVPVHCVPPDHWQAARSTGAYTLVGCTVGPGFEFADFEILRDQPELAAGLERTAPGVIEFL
jgi:predicted cupin superfamily sugar epimerase